MMLDIHDIVKLRDDSDLYIVVDICADGSYPMLVNLNTLDPLPYSPTYEDIVDVEESQNITNEEVIKQINKVIAIELRKLDKLVEEWEAFLRNANISKDW